MSTFNVWDFVGYPHHGADPTTYGSTKTREEAVRLIRLYTPEQIRHHVSEYFSILSAKIVLLDDYPTSNAATQALLADVIPTGATSESERRYIALMKREIATDYEVAVARSIADLDKFRRYSWEPYRWYQTGGAISIWLSELHHRCDKMVALMAKCEEDAQTTPAAANPAWIREGGMVENKEAIGVELTVGPNPLSYRKTAQGGLAGFRLPAVSTWYLGAFARIQFPEPDHIVDRVAGTTALTLTAKGGPIEYRAGGNRAAWVVLAKDSSMSWTKASLDSVVRIAMKPIPKPSVAGELHDVTIVAAVRQTVDVSSLEWTGTRLGSLSVTSSDTNVATVSYVDASEDIVVQAVAAGTATITATRTDAAGQTVSITFDVTVTAS